MSTPFLVKDIFPGSSTSFLRYLTAVGNTLFFRANNSVNGDELWKSDGTAAGTLLVKDIRPTGSSGSTPEGLTAMGNTLFFSANDGVNGFELWKSDGTAAGTVLVKNIFPGNNPSFSSSPRNLRVVGNTLYFTADDGENGRELWKSDGTATGTVLVRDIRPGSPTSSSDSDPSNLTVVGNTLFFSANDGVNFRKLWKSDGTAAGTVLVSASDGSYPNALTAVGSTLFFSAREGGGGGYELWKSDGTAAGTVLVKNIHPGSGGSFPGGLTAVGNTLYFTANDSVNGYELWKSNGTSAGTVLVADIRPGVPSSGPRNLRVADNTLYFTADDGVNGRELWKSDGTAAGTVLVANIRSGASGSISSSDPFNLTVVGNTLYFSANDGVNGYELWKSDGTAAGTVLVADIRSGSSSSNPGNLTVVGNTLFFSADDGVNGRELWALDVGAPAVPTLAIAATSANQTEGNSGSKAFTFTVTRADNTTGSNNVNWAVTGSGSNPANATDFVGGLLPSGTLSFAVGETSQVITVDVQGDTTVEPNENFTVTLSNATNGATITTATATGTIQNDDVAVPTLAIAATNANQTEGNSGSKAFTFTVTRAVNTTGSNNVNWAVTGSGSNPANATDFVGGVLPSGTLSFAVGETSQVITVDVQGDTTVELNENFTVTLSNATNGATITTATATGTINNDDFIGTSGSDTLAGTSAADAMTGLAGNDTYTVNDAGDLVIEALNQGTDTVQASISYTLTDNVENLTLTGTANLNGTGNNLNNILTGNSGNNILTGLAGNDSLDGKAGTDTMIGGLGNDTYTVDNTGDIVTENLNEGTDTVQASISYTLTDNVENLTLTGTANLNGTGNNLNNILTGNSGNNILTGLAGNDSLDGKAGTDTMIGGLGNDTYTVDNTGDIVTENLNEGTDTVKASISYTLTDNVENLTLTGTANLNGTGNNLNNILTGNSGNNILTGNEGNDTLNGAAGIDTLIGGLGNDTYQVDSTNDTITELANQGSDTIQSSVTYSIANLDNIENLTLTGNTAINATGNTANNLIVGNSGNNQINGGAGIDTLTGGNGADIFIFQFGQSTIAANDRITDFAINSDKIDLLTEGGLPMSAPSSFSRAANSTVTTLDNLINQVFTDANGATIGNQGLAVNSAALVQVTTGAIAGTYLVINDSAAGFQSSNDLLINITGFTGTLPALGSIPVSNFFV
ncbi:beta strand repeat-containing protein [Microcystis aeruginosa]|uniref:beta strand repeat-containing protein n=1 Tax=Microcystis aeruginosa TaxID=1126 RepID=UPI003B5A9B8F